MFILNERCFANAKKYLIKPMLEIFLSNITLFNMQDAIVNQLKIGTIPIKNLKAEKLKLNKNIFDIGLNFIGKN